LVAVLVVVAGVVDEPSLRVKPTGPSALLLAGCTVAGTPLTAVLTGPTRTTGTWLGSARLGLGGSQSTRFERLPIESLPIESLSIESLPIERLPIERLPIESLPIESLPIESLPIERLPIERLPIERLPIERLPIERLPIESLVTGIFGECTARSGPGRMEHPILGDGDAPGWRIARVGARLREQPVLA
jgi:hypothetical protein